MVIFLAAGSKAFTIPPIRNITGLGASFLASAGLAASAGFAGSSGLAASGALAGSAGLAFSCARADPVKEKTKISPIRMITHFLMIPLHLLSQN